MVLASAQKRTMPISRAELAARLTHRKFCFSVCSYPSPACFDPEWPNLIFAMA
jgi:hypothetical protein